MARARPSTAAAPPAGAGRSPQARPARPARARGRAAADPTAPPADVVSPAFEHLLANGSLRELTEEELARAVHLDPSQIAGLGPSLESLRQLLLERKQKILETFETDQVRQDKLS